MVIFAPQFHTRLSTRKREEINKMTKPRKLQTPYSNYIHEFFIAVEKGVLHRTNEPYNYRDWCFLSARQRRKAMEEINAFTKRRSDKINR